MRTPVFWRANPESWMPLVRFLEPFGVLYGAATALRLRWGCPWTAPIPVLCVGNVVAGGTGKTPVVLDLLGRLPGAHALSRGYGGVERGPLRVDRDRHDSQRVGDEALLLAEKAPTWVGRNRADSAKAAVQAGASMLVMDDGLQNPSLKHALSFIVIDGRFGLGNGRLIPAGPLREPLAAALQRADAIVVMGTDKTGVERRVTEAASKPIPVLHADLSPGPEAQTLCGKRVVAFAGIGNPEKFFDSLRDLGAEVVDSHPFADHYPYAPSDIQPILDEARVLGAVAVTTAKDAVRLIPEQRRCIEILTVEVVWRNEDSLLTLLSPLIRSPLP